MASEEKKAADGAAAGKTCEGEAVKGTPEYDLIVEHEKRLTVAETIRRDGWDALVEAEKEFETLVKDKVNPHFRNRYASEEAVYKAVKSALLNHSLVLTHAASYTADMAYLKTRIVYKGQVIAEAVRAIGPTAMSAQQAGSASTYAKRYNTCDLLALAAEEDDDGEAAQGAAAKYAAARGATGKADAPF